jgi:hypothetical protein
VSQGSHAEKLGIRDGDVIRCVNGQHISTTVEVDLYYGFIRFEVYDNNTQYILVCMLLAYIICCLLSVREYVAGQM